MMQDLDALISEHGLGDSADMIRRLAKSSVAIRTQPVEQQAILPGVSRFGGLPHLPRGMVWPRWNRMAMGHLATIKLSELPVSDPDELLPSRGLLYVWYGGGGEQPWGHEAAHVDGFRIDYLSDEHAALELATFPSDSPPAASRDTPVYTPCKVEFAETVTLPDLEWIDELAPAGVELSDPDAYEELWEAVWDLAGEEAPLHRLLGYFYPIQSLPEFEMTDVACRLRPEYRGFSDKAAYRKQFDELQRALRPVLQISSDEAGPNWMWGDGGKLYFALPEAALRARDFSRVQGCLQCY